MAKKISGLLWQPYAGLRHLRRPVDLIMLNSDEHVLINPFVRIASQAVPWTGSDSGSRGKKTPTPPRQSSTSAGWELRKMQEADQIRNGAIGVPPLQRVETQEVGQVTLWSRKQYPASCVDPHSLRSLLPVCPDSTTREAC
jgi:hypothetical protein